MDLIDKLVSIEGYTGFAYEIEVLDEHNNAVVILQNPEDMELFTTVVCNLDSLELTVLH